MGYHRIGASQAQTNTNNECVGVARFTCHEWDEGNGALVNSSHTCEVHVRFDPETKKWEVCELKQWEGKF
jgi:hypothetical protein